jgi:hypothetical protein
MIEKIIKTDNSKTTIIIRLMVGIVFLSNYIALFAQQPNYPENLYIYPYLQYATPTSIIIKWETKTQIIGSVIYSEDDSFDNTVTEASPVKIHEIKLKNLKPATNTIIKSALKIQHWKKLPSQPLLYREPPIGEWLPMGITVHFLRRTGELYPKYLN